MYRFRPNGDDHRSAIMEVIFLAPFTGERPPPAPVRWLSDDEPFSSVRGLATLGKVFDQDMFNMAKVQLGLETTYKPGVTRCGRTRWRGQRQMTLGRGLLNAPECQGERADGRWVVFAAARRARDG